MARQNSDTSLISSLVVNAHDLTNLGEHESTNLCIVALLKKICYRVLIAKKRGSSCYDEYKSSVMIRGKEVQVNYLFLFLRSVAAGDESDNMEGDLWLKLC